MLTWPQHDADIVAGWWTVQGPWQSSLASEFSIGRDSCSGALLRNESKQSSTSSNALTVKLVPQHLTGLCRAVYARPSEIKCHTLTCLRSSLRAADGQWLTAYYVPDAASEPNSSKTEKEAKYGDSHGHLENPQDEQKESPDKGIEPLAPEVLQVGARRLPA